MEPGDAARYDNETLDTVEQMLEEGDEDAWHVWCEAGDLIKKLLRKLSRRTA